MTTVRTTGTAPALTNEINVTPMIDVLLVLLIIARGSGEKVIGWP